MVCSLAVIKKHFIIEKQDISCLRTEINVSRGHKNYLYVLGFQHEKCGYQFDNLYQFNDFLQNSSGRLLLDQRN